jgi:putative membrane protein
MRNWLMRWIASALALCIVTHVVPGIHIDRNSIGTLIVTVIALGLINSLIRPIIMFFAWPVNCLTFGLFGFALNVFLFWFVGQNVPGFHVDNAVAALIGSVAMGLLSGLFNYFLADRQSGKE